MVLDYQVSIPTKQATALQAHSLTQLSEAVGLFEGRVLVHKTCISQNFPGPGDRFQL